MATGQFIRNATYYTGIVFEWNLPAGLTCPGALACKVIAHRYTGKQVREGAEFRCYAITAERFPGVRERRWENLQYLIDGGIPVIPEECKHIRIHSSGDFYRQEYFDLWLSLAWSRPDVRFWAFTKSLLFWMARMNSIPKNLILTASYGGKFDELIDQYKLKSAKVYSKVEDVPAGTPIDTNDDYARTPGVSFALLDNNLFEDEFVKRHDKFWK